MNLFKTIFQKLKFYFHKKEDRTRYKYEKTYISNNGKAKLYNILDSQSLDIITIHKITHEDGIGSILIKVHDINKLKSKTKIKIINNAQHGNLNKAESLIKRHNNINTKLYSHRLHILYRTNNKYFTFLIMDINLQTHERYKKTKQHIKNIFKAFLIDYINQPLGSEYQDAIIVLLKRSWSDYLIDKAKEYYKNSDIETPNFQMNIIYINPKIILK